MGFAKSFWFFPTLVGIKSSIPKINQNGHSTARMQQRSVEIGFGVDLPSVRLGFGPGQNIPKKNPTI